MCKYRLKYSDMKNYEGGFSESFAARNQQQSVESNHKSDGDNESVKFYTAPQTQKSESGFQPPHAESCENYLLLLCFLTG